MLPQIEIRRGWLGLAGSGRLTATLVLIAYLLLWGVFQNAGKISDAVRSDCFILHWISGILTIRSMARI